jgi:diguanylate cyclase (GGDEF)-like protein
VTDEPTSIKHRLFMAVFGLAGWGALIAASYGLGPGVGRGADTLSFLLFLLVIVASRSMAFRMLPETLVSLDSAFYIAAVICLGSVTAGRLVAIALTLDALLRLLGADAAGKRQRVPWAEALQFVVYFGGMTGGLLMTLGWLFGVDARPLIGRGDRELEVLWVVFALGGSLLVTHYLIQGVRLVLYGHSFSSYLRRMALPGIVAEASLLPLAVVVVLLYHPQRPLGFVLLGATYLLINFVFNRLSYTSDSLRMRVGELETLNRTAQELASSLQIHELIEAIARETLGAIPEAELIALSRREAPSDDQLVVDSYDREREQFERHRVPANEGVSALVLRERRPICIADLRREKLDVGVRNEPGVRSWLGVPIVVYDEAVGVLSVQSRERGAFGADQQRVLEAIGAQAAVAIQNSLLYELATVDGLTGLYVRRYFDSRIKEEMERSKRFETPFSLVILDIDDFKKLNDTHGHTVGDRVLREVAQVMRKSMRGVDIAARFGGEEFAFILPRTSIVDAHAMAERIRADVSEARVQAGGLVLKVTASLGVACYPESGEVDTSELIRRADIALYRAKATGKNRVELYWAEQADSGIHRSKIRPVSG